MQFLKIKKKKFFFVFERCAKSYQFNCVITYLKKHQHILLVICYYKIVLILCKTLKILKFLIKYFNFLILLNDL